MRIVFWITATVLLLGGLFSDVVDGQRFFRPIRRKLERLIILNIDIKYSKHYTLLMFRGNWYILLLSIGNRFLRRNIVRPAAPPVVRRSGSSFAKKCPYGCLTQGWSIKWLPKEQILNLIFILYFTITIGINLSISIIRKKDN